MTWRKFTYRLAEYYFAILLMDIALTFISPFLYPGGHSLGSAMGQMATFVFEMVKAAFSVISICGFVPAVIMLLIGAGDAQGGSVVPSPERSALIAKARRRVGLAAAALVAPFLIVSVMCWGAEGGCGDIMILFFPVPLIALPFLVFNIAQLIGARASASET